MAVLHRFYCIRLVHNHWSFIGAGAQFDNFYNPGTVDDNFSLLDAFIMLWVDTVLYMLLAWYVDNINPGDAGVGRPPWFPFMVSKPYAILISYDSY